MKQSGLFFVYLLVMAGVTYLIRALPFVLVKNEITNPRIKAFLDYIPYAVLASMTFPAILYATSSVISAACGLVAALILALRKKSLITVALASCAVVFVAEYVMNLMGVL
ncbi:MAG: AzlD domain-containing protein [Lachnospiraceae bacterium]